MNLHTAPHTLIELLDEALAEAAGDDVRLVRILGYRSWIRVFQADIGAALADARAALEEAELVGDRALIAAAIGQAATAEGRAGELTPGLLERGVELEERHGLVLGFGQSPTISLTRRLLGLGELDRARAILARARAAAAIRGDDRLRRYLDGSLGRLEWFAGNWQAAIDHLNLSDDSADWMRLRHHRGHTGRLRALAEADLGLVEQARTSAADGARRRRGDVGPEWKILILGVLGRLELMLGDVEAALGYLRELPAQLLSTGQGPDRPALGRRDRDADRWRRARHGPQLSRRARDERPARRQPRGRAGAARCSGLLAAAEGDPQAGASQPSTARSPRSRDSRSRSSAAAPCSVSEPCAGRCSRSAWPGRRSSQALAIFEELGARLWADKARAELARISGRTPASEELTETERRVAELAAQGRTNKQIAAELYMGLSTVESHLSHVYGKLGVRSGRARRAAQ